MTLNISFSSRSDYLFSYFLRPLVGNTKIGYKHHPEEHYPADGQSPPTIPREYPENISRGALARCFKWEKY